MSLDDIGQRLKAAREGQGLTLAQIYERTKIPLHHLQSIDSGNVDELPEPVYVSGFIKRYAETVGLNAQALVDEYKQEAAETKTSNGNGSYMRSSKPAQASAPVLVSANYSNRNRMDSGNAPSLFKTIFFPAIFIALLVGMLALLLQYRTYQNSQQSDPSILSLRDATRNFNSVQPSTTQVQPPAQTPTQGGQPDAQQTTPAADSSISITANKHVWVDVKALSTGESLYVGFLERGDHREYKDVRGVSVHAGNGGSLTIEADGKSAPLGLPGKIAEKTFLAKGASATSAVTAGATGASTAGAGSVLGSATGTTKPIVKKSPRKTASTDGAERRKSRGLGDSNGRSAYDTGYGRGSIDVPYKYTEQSDQ